MNRILRGAVVLAASALALGCSTEPDETEGGTPTAIVIDPGVLFIPRGDSQAVSVRLVDEQGTALNQPITISGAAAPIGVSIDSLFRPIFTPDGTLIANPDGTELRLFVRGDALGVAQFTVSAADLTETVNVTVTPTGITPTVSDVAPQVGEFVTVTPEAGLTFSPETELVDAAGDAVAIIHERAPDGSSLTVQFVPSLNGTFTVTNVVPSFAPSLTLDLPGTVAVAVALPAVSLTGVDDPATAPTLGPVTASTHFAIYDAGDMPGAGVNSDGARFYKLVVEEEAEYSVELSWPGGKDLGIWVYADQALTDLLGSDDSGGLDDGVETAHVELAPGTYYIEVGYFDYGAPLLPDWIRIDVFVE